MSRALSVVVVNGSPNERSKTMGLAGLVTSRLGELLPIELHQVDVHRLGPSFTGAIAREDVSPEVERRLRLVEEADVLVAATPVFRASYSGMFKHFFDLVDQYGLANKPVILVATGGSDRHALVIEHALRPLFGFFQAATAPVGFYANAGDFDGTLVLNGEVYSRVEVGVNDIMPRLRALADREPATAG
ncbi:FMN reductase [Thermocatellispora tengchongensis]|uniref:FMN reductase n=1 Tax=Thermocatellispora tengchongensis TaxID=1073253 RepID=A0A840P6Q5_9ACTN|nr:NAD(P)H-dependent oxidoreductase [Thermocatellispora tengchongensis]MBB5134266.1 FMN reductase [Thermocatellispora tengchongensis]